MHTHDPSEHAHHHDFAVRVQQGERRTRWVVILTVMTMIAELVAGQVTGSMALTADGWHMATHAGALGLALFAYWYARTQAGSRRFTWGTGKVYALAGYSSGVMLGMVALWMGIEAGLRLFDRPTVQFGEALPVAVIGLAVNLVSVWLLGGLEHEQHGHGHVHGLGPAHGHDHGPTARPKPARPPEKDAAGHDHAGHDHDHDHDHDHGHDHGHDDDVPTDHNLRAAYLHVIADALTRVLAIAALVAGEYGGVWWLDPAMGLLGGALIAKWSLGLCRDAAGQLLDVVPSTEVTGRIEQRLEAIDDVRIADLHLWELAPGKRGCIVSLVTSEPRQVEYYRTIILAEVELAHLTVEVHQCVRGHSERVAVSA